MISPVRDIRLDSIKGILILFVIFGHSVELTSCTESMRVLYNLIYSFHMPVFVFLSGYFTNTKKDARRYFYDVLNLFLVYIIFQVLKWLCFSREFTSDALLAPQWTWWYLLGLTYWRVMYYLLRKCSATAMLIIGISMSLIGGFVPVGTLFTLQRFFAHGAFFAMGFFVHEKGLLDRIYKIPNVVTIPMFLIFLAAQIYFYSTDINFLLWGRDQYEVWPIPLEYCAPARALWLLFSAGVIVLFLKYCPSGQTLQKFGINTLFLYAYHSFALGTIRAIHPQINDFYILGIAIVSVTVMLLILDRIKPLHRLLEPASPIKKFIIKES